MEKSIYARRVELLQESTTIAISTLARELKASGKDVLSFRQVSQTLIRQR